MDAYKMFATSNHLFEDECHFTLQGHQVMADWLYEELLQNKDRIGLLPPKPPARLGPAKYRP
jgi:hypothetical protein